MARKTSAGANSRLAVVAGRLGGLIIPATSFLNSSCVVVTVWLLSPFLNRLAQDQISHPPR